MHVCEPVSWYFCELQSMVHMRLITPEDYNSLLVTNRLQDVILHE